MKPNNPGLELAEKQIDEILEELGVFDPEDKKKYSGKILASVMVGILMDTMMKKE